jgi:hypothetical protein
MFADCITRYLAVMKTIASQVLISRPADMDFADAALRGITLDDFPERVVPVRPEAGPR